MRSSGLNATKAKHATSQIRFECLTGSLGQIFCEIIECTQSWTYYDYEEPLAKSSSRVQNSQTSSMMWWSVQISDLVLKTAAKRNSEERAGSPRQRSGNIGRGPQPNKSMTQWLKASVKPPLNFSPKQFQPKGSNSGRRKALQRDLPTLEVCLTYAANMKAEGIILSDVHFRMLFAG